MKKCTVILGSYVDGRDSTKKPEPYFHCGPLLDRFLGSLGNRKKKKKKNTCLYIFVRVEKRTV